MVGMLAGEIEKVQSVKGWANEAKIPARSLRRIMAEGYGKTPGQILKEVKYEKVIQILQQDAEAGAYCIALDSGFSSEDALRMFLRRCYGTNIRTLRKQILSGELQMEWVWMNGSG